MLWIIGSPFFFLFSKIEPIFLNFFYGGIGNAAAHAASDYGRKTGDYSFLGYVAVPFVLYLIVKEFLKKFNDFFKSDSQRAADAARLEYERVVAREERAYRFAVVRWWFLVLFICSLIGLVCGVIFYYFSGNLFWAFIVGGSGFVGFFLGLKPWRAGGDGDSGS